MDLPADHNDPDNRPTAQPGLEYRWAPRWGWALFPKTDPAPKPKRRKRRKCPLCNDTGEQRYWEGRWRDEKADNERLEAENKRAHAEIERLRKERGEYVRPDLQENVFALMKYNERLRADNHRMRDLLAFNYIDPEALVEAAAGAWDRAQSGCGEENPTHEATKSKAYQE